MNKKQLSERDICTKYITPALEKAGWDVTTQIREEFPITKGRIIVRGKLHTRTKQKRADYVLFYKPNIPIAIIEAKDNNHTVGDGMQQALGYADMLQVPFVFSSNGDGFLFHNKIAASQPGGGIVERELALHDFPAAQTLWQWWARHRDLNDQQNVLVTQDYFSDGGDKSPRYYQLLAINKTTLKRGLLTEFNLHTIVRMPKGVFSPSTSIATNILFFEKGEPTKEVWFFAHPYPDGYKSNSCSQPLTIAEFDLEKSWWGGASRHGRKTTEQARKVSAKELVERNYNLDCKNPDEVEVNHREPAELMADYQQIVHQLEAVQADLKAELMACLGGKA